MDLRSPRDRTYLALSPVLVLAASFFGLLRDLKEFGHVWSASIAGDAIFCVTTVAAFWGSLELGRRSHPAVTVLVGSGLTILSYMASWAVTGPAAFGKDGTMGWAFVIGWPGMIAMGFAYGAIALAEWLVLARREGGSAEPSA